MRPLAPPIPCRPTLLVFWLAVMTVLGAAARPVSAEPAPEVSLSALKGPAVTLSQFRGRPVVVDFWATWCEPCKAAMAEHAQLIALYGPRLGFISVDLDEDPAAALQFLERHPLNAPALHDPTGAVASAYGVAEMPYAVVVGPDGQIAERLSGPPYPRLWSVVERLMAAANSGKPSADRPGCPGLVDREATAMGTHIALRVCPGTSTPDAVNHTLDAAIAEIVRLEGLWSTWIPTSEISKIDAAAGGPAVPVSAETFALLKAARAGSERFEGLFDVTFAPLGSLWTFDTPPGAHVATKLARVPTAAEIEAKQALVGYRGLILTPTSGGAGTVRLERVGMAVHLGGIGKGAAVDRVVTLLRHAGYQNFCAQAGGDLFCAGRNGDRPWRVGIAHPRQPGALIGALDVENAAFSTSGDYERFAIIDGKRYHHILDPRTGMPATASQSATVLAPTATDAEILTKVSFILGGEAGLSALARAGAKGVLVDAAGARHVSPGLPLGSP